MRMGVFEDISSGHVLMYQRTRRLCFILCSGMACVGCERLREMPHLLYIVYPQQQQPTLADGCIRQGKHSFRS